MTVMELPSRIENQRAVPFVVKTNTSVTLYKASGCYFGIDKKKKKKTEGKKTSLYILKLKSFMRSKTLFYQKREGGGQIF